MPTFEWTDVPIAAFQQEMRIAIKEKIHEATARRRNLDQKIESAMFAIRDFEIRRDAICNEEDRLRDELERIKP